MLTESLCGIAQARCARSQIAQVDSVCSQLRSHRACS